MNFRNGFVPRILGAAGTLALIAQFFATPAWASYSAEISVNGVVTTTATSSTTPAIVSVPFDNSVDAGDAVRISITGIEAGASVTVAASNALIVGALSTNLLPVRANAGTSQSVTTGVATAELFVYTTSTALASFTVTSGSTANTYYLKASAGPAYNIESTLPTKGYVSSYSTLPLKITDVFGNAVVGTVPTVSAIGFTASAAPATDVDGNSQIDLTYPKTAGSAALQVSIAATNVTGLTAAKARLSSIIPIVDLEAQLAAEKSLLVSEKTAFDAEVARLKKLAEDAKTAYDAEVARLTKLAADTKISTDEDAAVAKALADKAAADAKTAYDAEVARLTKLAADTKVATDKAAADAKTAYDAEVARLTKLAADTKVATDKAAADAKTAADKAISDAKALQTQAEASLASLRTTSEAKVTELNSVITKLNTDVTSLNTKLSAATAATAAIDVKYKALVKKYNTLAKKYKQPTIKP